MAEMVAALGTTAVSLPYPRPQLARMEKRIVSLLEGGEVEEILALLSGEPGLRRTEIEDGRTLLQLALQYDREQLANRLLDELEEGDDDGTGTAACSPLVAFTSLPPQC